MAGRVEVDGIRAQLIKRDGRVMIWSRRRIGRRFLSEIMLAANALPPTLASMVKSLLGAKMD